ncbi:MAG TPA: MBL fold metallo-hydrolase [Polyangiaceae bacterium]|nr:MBL fold metallo-hydrolase [Polyangiaceae bacterium]
MHEVAVSTWGKTTTLEAIERVLDAPGPLDVETVESAGWQSPRGGLINLQNPKAAQLEDGPEPIAIYFHAISHPSRGLFLVDTGVEQALTAEDHPLRQSEVGRAFGFGALQAKTPLGSWLDHRDVSGVFLTHLHLDHVLGLPDVPLSTPVFVGPGETTLESAYHGLTQPAVDARLAGRPALQEWHFDGAEALDVFEDQSLFVLSSPGHTPGSVVFLARTKNGPVLFTGDTCHTAWGWQNGVEPGTFSHDLEENAASLTMLRELSVRHPGLAVRLGHQSI